MLSLDKTKQNDWDHYYQVYYTEDFTWGKACTTKTGYEIMGQLRQCKDYLIDLHYRDQDHIVRGNWSEEQINEVCYYLHIPNKNQVDNFLKNVVEFLNPIEKANLFKHTIASVETVEEMTFIVIKGSDMWGKNCLIRSIYLTLIRWCAYLSNLKITTIKDFASSLEKNNYSNNEYYCIQHTTAKQLEFFFYCIYNPRKLLSNPHKTPPSGYVDNKHFGHGSTGLIYQLRYGRSTPNVITLYKEWEDANY